MRTEAEIKERIRYAIIEQINSGNFQTIQQEPENLIPVFVDLLTNKLSEICIDEITFRRRI